MSVKDIDETKLSDEELAAINGADDADEAELIDDALGEELKADDDGDADDDGGNINDSDDSDNENDSADEDASASAQDDGNEYAVNDSAFVPQPTAPPVENYTGRMQEFSKQKEALLERLRDGDIDIEEYEKSKNTIIEQEFELKLAHRDYENSIRQQQETAKQKWEWEQEQFFENEANKIYRDEGILGTAMSAALNKKVIELANDPANVKRSGTWFLNEADRQVREAMNMAPQKQTAGKPNNRKPDLTSIPKTLSNLPAAESTETGNGEFAYLDKLEGVELEQALAAISRDPAKEARYLRQA